MGHVVSIVELRKLVLHRYGPQNGSRPLIQNTQNDPHIRRALQEISKSSTAIRALIIDFFCTSALPIAMELHIPTNYFYTYGAAALAAFLYFPKLRGEVVGSAGSSVEEGIGGWVCDTLWLDLGARSSGFRDTIDCMATVCRAPSEQRCSGEGHGNGDKGGREIEEDGFVSGEELERKVRELMELERGRALRERSKKTGEMAMAALGETGSSTRNLVNFVNSIG
ncbi:glycosyltransferase [Pyrus ussuriensis x Pyrus communis]|uniref:Glycosyltransferase n=1 Tax=Pyrus ussuriensis x Pyrus communis TaxID=2448454 RepID=A0A5N5FU55_9ROSA|nr:glycosyltransferase [Pyrus ussuriensis x Pyrus communis]